LPELQQIQDVDTYMAKYQAILAAEAESTDRLTMAASKRISGELEQPCEDFWQEACNMQEPNEEPNKMNHTQSMEHACSTSFLVRVTSREMWEVRWIA